MHELGRLKELIARHAGEGLTPTTLPGVSVFRATAVTEPLGEMAEPAVAVIAQGVKTNRPERPHLRLRPRSAHHRAG